MKNKTEKKEVIQKIETTPKKIFFKTVVDETYLEINQTSFRQNFTYLLAHYKNNVTTT